MVKATYFVDQKLAVPSVYPVYPNIENLVLWARSEAVGYAVERAEKNTEFRIR